MDSGREIQPVCDLRATAVAAGIRYGVRHATVPQRVPAMIAYVVSVMIKPIKHYRPERHYMRGPGPKWLEKHGGTDRVDPVMDDHRSDKRLLAGFFFQLARSWRD